MKADINFLKNYIPKGELSCLLDSAKGEEGEFFRELLAETEQKIRAVPPLYANEEIGLEAPIRLHYFGGGIDFYISELDQDTGEAFGIGSIYEKELGALSIPEIVATNRLELDLYWNDKTTLKEILN